MAINKGNIIGFYGSNSSFRKFWLFKAFIMERVILIEEIKYLLFVFSAVLGKANFQEHILCPITFSNGRDEKGVA